MAQASPTATASTTTPIAPPPWDLVGCGAILWLRPAGGGQRRGPLDLGGSLAFVDYERSGVDPYLELLHVPYFTHSRGTLGPTIDRIWVTSQRSVDSGRANWAIPKDLAQITRDQATNGAARWHASLGGELLASLAVTPVGPRLPVIKPRRAGRLLQRMHGVRYATPIDATGTVRFARVNELRLGPTFDDIDPARVGGAVIVERFRMGFHAAEIG
jgi:Acetoacetate decarboxylase (ADC)